MGREFRNGWDESKCGRIPDGEELLHFLKASDGDRAAGEAMLRPRPSSLTLAVLCVLVALSPGAQAGCDWPPCSSLAGRAAHGTCCTCVPFA